MEPTAAAVQANGRTKLSGKEVVVKSIANNPRHSTHRATPPNKARTIASASLLEEERL